MLDARRERDWFANHEGEQYGVPTAILDPDFQRFINSACRFHRSGVQPFAKLLYAMLIPASRLGHSLPLPWGEPTIF
jgi:hypothetical protein